MILQKIFTNKKIMQTIFFNKSAKYDLSTHKKILLFGGQGNQQKGILDKFLEITEAKNLLESQSQKLGVDLLQISTTDKASLINITKYTQPLLLISQYLQFLYGEKKVDLSQRNSQNTYCIGHSLGEYTALLISGSISLSDCLKLVYLRGQLMIKASSENQKLGTLIIKFREDKLPRILQQTKKLNLEVSCYNSPTNIVVSGAIDELNNLKNYMKTELRIVSKVLPAATAFHSSHLQKMKPEFKQILQKINFQPPKLKIVRNLDCQIYKKRQDIIQGLLQQNTHPVLFTNSVQKIIKSQGKQSIQFVEIGHKEYLSRWVDEVKKIY